jgi:FtsP/CotA-like multicopper oxidase with cupredoxin domain
MCSKCIGIGGIALSNRGIAVLSGIALIVVMISGMIFFRNHLFMQNTDMAMSHNNNTAANTSMQMPEGTKMQEQETTQEKTAVKTGEGVFNNHDYAKNLIKPREGQPVKKFTLTAQESKQLISSDIAMPVFTYNGTVPGQEIRVTQGDFVQVELKNTLQEPVTIHWHGYPLLSAMDGVPGWNQDSVKPGETFTYQFSADVSGTYWYHSHQESSKQVDKGLYGALIVEPKEKGMVNKEFTLILDEWMSDPKGMEAMEAGSGSTAANSDTTTSNGHAGMDMTGSQDNNSSNTGTDMAGMDMSGNAAMTEEEMMAYMYDIYTVNGKSGELIQPLDVNKGDVVRLRFINAGYRSHGIHIPGQEFKVVSTDGQEINGAGVISDQIINIAPGERYDVEFTVTSEDSFFIDAHDENAYNDQLRIPVNVQGGSGNIMEESMDTQLNAFDLASYGTFAAGKFSLDQQFTIDYKVELNTRMDGTVQKYTINGKIFNELPPLKVKTGDLVKFTFENKSTMDHPMHLHGHFFQVLSGNDSPFTGAPIMKDTLLVRPGEKFVVAFKADNTGRWVQHCHELHHAAGGMMQAIEYTDFNANYTPDPSNKDNKPE